LGVVELATSAETITGTDTERAVTPKAASDLVADRQASKRFVKQYTAEAIGKEGVVVTHNLNCDYIIVQVWMITEGETAKEFTIGEVTSAASKEVVHTEITQIDKMNAAIHVDMVPAGILEVCIIAVC